jgi:hypothetical protein
MSFALHALVIGALVLVGYFATLPRNVEPWEPPAMDVVEIQGGGGTGGIGGGPGVGLPMPGQGTQIAKVNQPQIDAKNKPDIDPLKVKTPQDNLQVQTPKSKPDNGQDKADVVFDAVLTQAQEEVARAMNVPVEQVQSAGNLGGTPGEGGGYGGGKGGGKGKNTGPGGGTSLTGKVLTRSQIRQGRWLIDFTGDGLETLKKMKRLKVTLALPTNLQGVFQLVNLAGPAIRFDNTINLEQHTHKAMWMNKNAQEMTKLAVGLKLQSVPRYAVIFLPEDVEQELADIEVRHQGVPEHLIQYTRFSLVQQPNGSYQPVVAEQQVQMGGGQAP